MVGVLLAGVVSNARTFSIRTWGGRRASIARTISDHRPDWVPGRSPSLVPASEISVQGNPPHRRSTGPIPQRTRDQLMRRTSPRLGTPGQCLARTAFAARSVSQCQTTVPLVARSTARSSMPLPENMLPILMGIYRSLVLRFAMVLRRRPHRSHLAPERGWGSWVCLYRENRSKNRCINADGVQQAMGDHTYQVSHMSSPLSIPMTFGVSPSRLCGGLVLRPPMSYLGLDKEGHSLGGARTHALARLYV